MDKPDEHETLRLRRTSFEAEAPPPRLGPAPELVNYPLASGEGLSDDIRAVNQGGQTCFDAQFLHADQFDPKDLAKAQEMIEAEKKRQTELVMIRRKRRRRGAIFAGMTHAIFGLGLAGYSWLFYLMFIAGAAWFGWIGSRERFGPIRMAMLTAVWVFPMFMAGLLAGGMNVDPYSCFYAILVLIIAGYLNGIDQQEQRSLTE